MRLTVDLEPVEAEAERKIESLLSPSDREVEALYAATSGRGEEVSGAVREAVAFMAGQESHSEAHPSIAEYLVHPVRVARMVAQCAPDASAELLQAAVVHNVTEVAGVGRAGLEEAGFPPSVGDVVALLTVDRDRDRDRGYLAAHYAAIESAGPGPALVKCVDRLDNILGLAPFEGDFVHGGYVDLTEEFIVPMAGRLAPGLGSYLEDAVAYARRTGFDPELARRRAAASR